MGTYFLFFLNEEEIKKKLSFGEGKKRSSHLTPSFSLSLSLSCCFLTFSKEKRTEFNTARKKKITKNMKHVATRVIRKTWTSPLKLHSVRDILAMNRLRPRLFFIPTRMYPHISVYSSLVFFVLCLLFLFFFSNHQEKKRESRRKRPPTFFSLLSSLFFFLSLSFFFLLSKKKRERERESTNREVLPSLSSVKPHA